MHLMFLAASAASIAVAGVLAAPAFAQETTSTIRGGVLSEGSPVAGDRYTVSVSAPGYASAQVTGVVTVLAQSYELPIDLAAAA